MSKTGSRYKSAPRDAGAGSPPSRPQDEPVGLQPESSSFDSELTVISSRGPIPAPDRPLPPLEAGQIREGDRLGQFLLLKFVGGGGMGIVFRALDTTLNREVALKILSRDQSVDEETLRRFKNEAQSAARLDHENIARVHYVGEDRGLHYIVFEFIEGVNIRDLVQQRGPLPIDESLSYTFQIAEALAHASRRDVIHRDIKPSNVLITPHGVAKLVDMGLARLHQVEHASNDLTASGVTLGTFDYISPEQARDPRVADVRSDLYSLGCSLHYMLTGRPPFPDGTLLQKLLQHQADEPPDPRALRPDVPAELCRILARMLAKNPARRYQDPGALIDDLLVVSQQLGMPQTTALSAAWLASHPHRPAWRHHLPWLVPLAALVVIVLALDYYWSRWPGAIRDAPPEAPRNVAPVRRSVTVPARRANSNGGRRTPAARAPLLPATTAGQVMNGTGLPVSTATVGEAVESVSAAHRSSAANGTPVWMPQVLRLPWRGDVRLDDWTGSAATASGLAAPLAPWAPAAAGAMRAASRHAATARIESRVIASPRADSDTIEQ